jgi:hypothetical protein
VEYQALYANTVEGNTAVGYQAGDSITTGTYNTVVGFGAGRSITTGTLNTFIGVGNTSPSGSEITTGSKNVILGGYNGNQGGLDIRTASNYIVLSDGDGNPLVAAADNKTLSLEGAVPQSGTGITFPATQSASSDANTLDDYEEGTFTPVIKGSGGNPTVSYTTQLGYYVKVGRQVTIFVRIRVNTISGGSGLLFVDGLPFTSSQDSDECGGPVGLAYLYSSNPTQVVQVEGGTTYVYLMRTTANSNNQVSDLADGCYINFTANYVV